MSKVVATTVLPEDSGEVLTFGDTSDAIAISGDSLNLNKLQDAGGNNIFISDGSGTLTVPSVFGGAFNLLNTNTFTGTTTSNFTTKITSTYDVYKFAFNAINPVTDGQQFGFQGSTDGGSNYNVTMTTTFFWAIHDEANTITSLEYSAAKDQQQGTSYQPLGGSLGNESQECITGELFLFSPSSTTYVKHFYATTQMTTNDDYSGNSYIGGYLNTTSAINAFSFKMASGNMNGEIKMYGISKS